MICCYCLRNMFSHPLLLSIKKNKVVTLLLGCALVTNHTSIGLCTRNESHLTVDGSNAYRHTRTMM